ncbi:MAG: flagellar biosynthesis anti-sigma factor FlgM [Bdellovibrionales bacterium]|nr:flagellar biosynthesis anti-sigma factor FlgM [Bdellovibrionales bacterium]
MKISSNNNATIQNRPAQTSDAASAAATSASKRSEKADASKAAAASRVDAGAANTEISGKAREFARAKEVAAQAPDVREDRIAELKAKIAAGNYKVNSQAIADRMVDEHIASGIG